MPQDNIIQPGGLHTDNSLVNQPLNTTRFVLNGVNETDEGDRSNIANEESNEICYEIPVGFIPMGKVYIGQERTMIFFASDLGNSMIGICDRECNLTIIVDDSNQVAKLGFSTSKQIDATYRLRRGCEDVVYFVDPKPRIFIYGKEEEFKDSNGDWDVSKFSLYKTYSTIPEFDDIEVLNDGGVIPPGKINVSIQYLDEDFNPSEWITSTEGVYIYNSDFTNAFRDIRGSSSKKVEWRTPVDTNKAIRVTLSELDTTFPFYRLAFIESTNGDGQINAIKYTQPLSTQNNIFTYTGKNFETLGTLEEIALFNGIIEEADSIEQIENRLVLGNVKGKNINFCNLQKYASRITADMVTKKIYLNTLSTANPKHPSAEIDGQGYMPGEIHSFAIVYIFDDNTTTPAYHIPGKNPNIDPSTIYSVDDNVYPMSSWENTSDDNTYTDNNTCDSGDYWGVDSENFALKNTKVRHHRFPLRTDVGLPLLVKEDTATTTNIYKTIKIKVSGEIDVPYSCPLEGEDGYDPMCVNVVAPEFQYRVYYTVDGGPEENFTFLVDPADWAGSPVPYMISQVDISNIIVGDIVVITKIEENGVLIPGTAVDDTYTTDADSPKGVIYEAQLSTEVNESKDDLYSSQIMGIKFSNIQIPSDADLNGQKIIGYYIVRNERTEGEKTILDSAVLTSTVKNSNFVSHGHLMPSIDVARIKKDVVSMINPEFKFNDKKYSNFTSVIHQGTFVRTEAINSRTKTRDIMDGTGYVDGKHKDGESDDDGWTLQIKTRDNITSFKNERKFDLVPDDIKQTFYLNALEDKIILDKNDNGIDVFNLAADNKIGIMSLTKDLGQPIVNSVPYVYLYRRNANPYYNYRTDAYYKETLNPVYFGDSQISSVEVFNGDSYITPIKYVNSIFYDMRYKQRAGKTSVWAYIAAAVLVVVAVVIAIFSWGSATAGSIALIGLAAGLVGGAAALTMSGIKQDAWNRAYNELYNKGLRETIADNYLQYDGDCSSIENDCCIGYVKNPQDDEIQWGADSLNLWFESNVNMNLRVGATDNTPDFLGAPAKRELGYPACTDWDREYFGIHSVGSSELGPTTTLDVHMLKKLTYLDSNRKGGRAYVGLPLAEIYEINPDYMRRNKQKFFYHLGLEYDCCSDCNETFPQRFHWSEQSFQEELTDNYRTFLPNNYKDIEGNTGHITDLYRIQNNLYIHTQEALWHQPQNFQERITGDVVSFIGTGEFFNIPPRKIVDDNNSSAGNNHKWGRTKTKYGVLFPSHKEKKWYIFNGEQLEPISDKGEMNFFKENMRFRLEERFYKDNVADYPYRNNPSNLIGTGYISVYDTKKERLIITKKDIDITNLPEEGNYQVCNEGGDTILFENFPQIIADKEAEGFSFIGIENCRLKFVKTEYIVETQIRQITTTTPNDSNIYAFFDTSGSFDLGQLNTVKASVAAWYADLVANGHTGTYTAIDDASERWLNYPSVIPAGGNVIVLTFVNESNPVYHDTTLDGVPDGPTGTYIADYTNFINNVYPNFNFFAAINYPIATSNIGNTGKVFIQHAIAAVYGRNMTLDEVNELEVNSAFTSGEWTLLKASLLTNPYSSLLDGSGNPGLQQFNWVVKSNKNDLGTPATEDCPASGAIITPCQFSVDTNQILADFVVTEEIEVEVQVPVITTEYVEGEVFEPEILVGSFTKSYSLKDRQWTSYHSYLPDFYFHDQERFFSWKHGYKDIWKHNRKNHYQTFYGQYYPFIIEYVDISNALATKIWEGLTLQTEAKRWDADAEEYVDQKLVTFNKILAYNTSQISGILEMITKSNDQDYILEQIINAPGTITIDRNERDWSLNELRDIRVDYGSPMFKKKLEELQANYFIDKVVNEDAIDINKDWTQMESFRDKFLVVRLIFDKFDHTRLLMNFSIQDAKQSER